MVRVTMTKTLPQRKKLRLKGYDYSSRGMYSVTICIQDRRCLFGTIVNVGDGPRAIPKMVLNDVGSMIDLTWKQMPNCYPGVEIDEFIIMPNHIHGVIVLDGQSYDNGRAQGPAPTMSLFDVVHRFKSMTTTRYRYGVNQHNWTPFSGKLWQRNYYEHIIRDDDELNKIREYIQNNPLNWDNDSENTKGKT